MIVRWQINTQMSTAVNDVPYRLAFGQLPRVGISALPLSAELLSSLATEADLNQALGVDKLVPLEEARPGLFSRVQEEQHLEEGEEGEEGKEGEEGDRQKPYPETMRAVLAN